MTYQHPDLEALTAEEYADELAREREFEALQAQLHAETGCGVSDDGSERPW